MGNLLHRGDLRFDRIEGSGEAARAYLQQFLGVQLLHCVRLIVLNSEEDFAKSKAAQSDEAAEEGWQLWARGGLRSVRASAALRSVRASAAASRPFV